MRFNKKKSFVTFCVCDNGRPVCFICFYRKFLVYIVHVIVYNFLCHDKPPRFVSNVTMRTVPDQQLYVQFYSDSINQLVLTVNALGLLCFIYQSFVASYFMLNKSNLNPIWLSFLLIKHDIRVATGPWKSGNDREFFKNFNKKRF